MLHACVRRFDVTGTVQNILGTKQGLIIPKWNNRPMTDTEAHSKGSLSCKRGLSIAAYKEGRDLAMIHYLHIESWKKIPHMLLLNPKFFGAGTLLYISSLIGRLMQYHIEFLVMWRRESEVREKCGCFAKQPSHRLKFRSIRLLYKLLLPCNSKYFFYFIHKSWGVV